MRRGRVHLALVVAVLLAPTLARAAEGDTDDTAAPRGAPKASGRPWFQLVATGFVGDGLRFNNPYRLSTVLGSRAESVSRTAAYADFGLGVTFGNALGLQHGATVRVSVALEGVQQAVLVPAYLGWYRWRPFAAYVRAGVPIVTGPQPTWGLEGGLGGVWFVRAGIGIALEIVGDVFYGEGTRDKAITSYPVLSGQAGLVIAYEVLP